MLDCLSLFSGIGAFDLAASWAGVRTTQMIELDPFCQKVLRKNFLGIPIHDDIRTYSAKPFQFGFIIGGPPCQGFSVAGQKQGFSDDRSILFFEFTRLIEEVQPLGFIMENVPGIYDWMPQVIQALAKVGAYHCFWFSLSASQLGGCHRRNRWFCVGVSANSNGDRQSKGWSKKAIQQEQPRSAFIPQIPADTESERKKWPQSQHLQEGTDQAFISCGEPRGKENVSRVCREDDGSSRGMDRSRLMTRDEAWELIYAEKSCDNRKLPDRGKRIKALGNSVTPQQYYVAWLTLFELMEKINAQTTL